TSSVYKWNDHYIVFDKVADQFVLLNALKKELEEVTVRNYQDPFYDFNRNCCADTTTSTEWEHILLTANLVADKKLQQEYLDMHATQFEKWPEVSNGFCNASFQRLLLYRNGRQLMLVISIPKGKTLAELDPLTIKNNPRMNDWNKIMRKYQEGIPGTNPGDTWVFLTPLSKP
ncbi:MAG: L-rhamnose mutarotase, partial [Chitinophagaceae bacterium]|nr:L-rhamnose mutarotase [Chitinophagaceae bacterium]